MPVATRLATCPREARVPGALPWRGPARQPLGRRAAAPRGHPGSHPEPTAGPVPRACWVMSIFGNPWRLCLIHRHLASEMENFTCRVAMETSRATEKIYAEWSAPSLHQMPCVSRIPSQAVRPPRQAWRLAPRQRSRPLPLRWMQAALRWACPALWAPDPSPCALRPPGSRPPPPLPPDLVSPGAGRGAPNGLSASGRWRGWEPPAGVAPRPRPSSCPPCPFPQTAALRGGGLVPVPAVRGATG